MARAARRIWPPSSWSSRATRASRSGSVAAAGRTATTRSRHGSQGASQAKPATGVVGAAIAEYPGRVTDSAVDAREAFRTTELRLRLLLLGDGSETPGYVKGEDPRRRISAELRHLREAFAALGEEGRPRDDGDCAGRRPRTRAPARRRRANEPAPRQPAATPIADARGVRPGTPRERRHRLSGGQERRDPCREADGTKTWCASDCRERAGPAPRGADEGLTRTQVRREPDTALTGALRHETESTPSRLISSSLQPNART